jgi:hypothetical protein
MHSGRGFKVHLLAIVALGTALASCAVLAKPALADCQPSSPTCATRYGAFDDQDDFEQCKRNMNSYKSEVELFLLCVQNDADLVRRQYNGAVDSFNRRARG